MNDLLDPTIRPPETFPTWVDSQYGWGPADQDWPACWSWQIYTPQATSPLEALEQWQKNTCAICGWKPDRFCLVMDHCHNTGMIRGLLCQDCNRDEGRLDTDAIIRYRYASPTVMLGLWRKCRYTNPWRQSEYWAHSTYTGPENLVEAINGLTELDEEPPNVYRYSDRPNWIATY